MEQTTFVPSLTSRIPYFNYLPLNRAENFENESYKYTIVVAGGSGKGKDTMVSSFDPSLKKDGKIKIGNGIDSCTRDFQYVKFSNETLIRKNQGFVLNTVGLGDTSLKIEDHEIVTEIFSEIVQNASRYSGGIDAFFFVQSLTDAPINSIEKTILYMQAALGNEIFKSSIIIATKGNKISDPDELDTNMKALIKLAQKYGIKGGVIDYRCPYEQLFNEKIKLKTPISDKDLILMQAELHSYCLIGLDFFDLKPLLNDLQVQIKKIEKELKEKCKKVQEKQILVKKTERRFYTLWLYEHEVEYYDKVFFNIFTKTDPVILEEAKKQALEIRISEMKCKLEQLNKL